MSKSPTTESTAALQTNSEPLRHRKVWALSWPIIIANLSAPLVGLVDTAVMGHMSDPSYLAAVAVGSAIFTALYWSYGFLRMGTTALVAQAFGSKQSVELSAVALRALMIAGAFAALMLSVSGLLKTGGLLVFEASTLVEDKAAVYFDIRLFGLPAVLLQYVVFGVLFGTQRMGLSLVVSAVTNITNIGLDFLFVVGFGWGVEGVATGTAIAEWCGALVGLLLAWRALRAAGAKQPQRQEIFNRARLMSLFQVSGNLIVRSLFVQLPFLLFAVFGARFGSVVLAANAILMQLMMTMAFALDAFAHSAETLAGEAYGGKDARRLRDVSIKTGVWAVGTSIAIAMLYAGAGPLLISLMTDQRELIDSALTYLPWVVAAPLLSVIAFQLDGVFIGTTQTATLRNAMAISFAAYALCTWLAIPVLGNHGIWLGMSVFFIVRSVILLWRYPGIEAQLSTATR
ncbi:MAG: MATE family efflux transporter [Pseudomonadaceae bacterium]|nr:MATE family efflux transporter [Pseudomonadaceae bacterium]